MRMNTQLLPFVFVFVLTACCSSESAPTHVTEATDIAAPSGTAAVSGTGLRTSGLLPWKKEADCYWVLKYPDGVAERAWIGADGHGVYLTIVDDSLELWPVSDVLPIALIRDGSAERSRTARGVHGDGDAKAELSVLLDEPQRALIAGAKEIAVKSPGRAGFTLPMAGAPHLAALEKCDFNPGNDEVSGGSHPQSDRK